MNKKLLYFRLIIFICVSTLAGLVGCSQQSADNPNIQAPQPPSNSGVANAVEPTMFNCIQKEEVWSTFAQRGNAISKEPLITWNSPEFGNDWTPEKRCNTVSQRLTDAVIQNGGRLGGLSLTTGTLNTLPVVCYVKERQSRCDDSNLLFTLNKQNAKNPSAVLAKMMNFGQGLAADGIAEKDGTPQYISLEEAVKKLLPQDNGF